MNNNKLCHYHFDYMNLSRVQQFGEILQKIPLDTWDVIVRLEPECQHIGPYQYRYHFGGFVVLMVILGLNSYQLKGKAEKHYWYAVHQHLSNYPFPQSKEKLKEMLIDFYKKERLPKGKLKRLDRFFSSSLTDQIWKSEPMDIINNFHDYWHTLAQVMGQKKTSKTICFAMKCLGVSVLLTDDHEADFSFIPIPVDSRVALFTENANFTNECSQKNIQCVWDNVLEYVQQIHPTISMIHLDSLIWQIGTLNSVELKKYFTIIHLPEMADEIIDFMI